MRLRPGVGGLRHAARVRPGPHARQPTSPTGPQDAPYFNPPGPAKDGSPSAIVSGFLVAMQANPLSTSVARTFLSERARAGLEAQPRHDRLRGVRGRDDQGGARCGWPTPAASTRGAAGAAARRGRLRDPRHPAGLRGRPVAHRQPAQRAGGADLVLRPQLRAVQPLLLRPDRQVAAAGPGLHPARRADRHQPGPRPARRARPRTGRGHPLRPALAHRPGPVRRRDRERGRRGAAVAGDPAGLGERA